MEAYLLVAFVLVMVGETALTLVWSPAYFRFGLRIFTRTRQVTKPGPVPTADDLPLRLPQSTFPTLVFRDFGNNTYGFREKLFELGKFGYSTVMRGVIEFDPHRGHVTVNGYLNWFTPIFLIVAISFLINLAVPFLFALFFLGVAAGIVAWVHGVQGRRFAEVADVAASSWDTALES